MPRTNAGTFVQGKAGEKYVRRHLNSFLAHGIVTQGIDTAGDFVEGGDNRITYIRFGEEVDIADFDNDGMLGLTGTGYAIAETLVGGLEVKTISNFTFRTNDNNEPSGTLPFELWDRDRYGWLLALLCPEMRLEREEIHAVQPVLFCFLLVSYLGPYACVMFEDFPALAQRLNELAEEKGFQLSPLSADCPQGIPAANEADTWRQDDPYIIGNCWHIPFDRLSDLATVTLIGNRPLEKRPIDLNADDSYIQLQQSRYEYLEQCADGRMLPESLESRKDFYPADETRLFADVLNNMEIVESLNPEDYPYLCQALKSIGLKAHLQNILYNMYSHDLLTTINGNLMWFFQAKKYLHTWSRKYKVRGSAFSWQSHVIFLTDTELLKKFVVQPGPKVFRSVPKYTEEVLHFADNKAKVYLDAGINLNDFTKEQVIRVSGEERANILYYGDERKISAMHDVVDNEFIETARLLLAEREFILPCEIESVVSEKLNKRYWVDPLDIEKADPKTVKNYEQVNRQIARLSKRYEELSRKIPCLFRGLSIDEKTAWGISRNTRKKYYVKPSDS